MCQIIGIKTTFKNLKEMAEDQDICSEFGCILSRKGEDFNFAGATYYQDNRLIIVGDGVEDIFKEIYEITFARDEKSTDEDIILNIILFSRQQPEMELDNVDDQPYVSEVDGTLFAVHGTIHNDKKLAKELGVHIGADTEILKFLPFGDWSKAEGTFCAVSIDKENLNTFEHGLKLWKTSYVKGEKWVADLVMTTQLPETFLPDYIEHYPFPIKKEILSVAFSGGMDIALSTFQQLFYNKYKKLILNYFAWGSIAEEQEIKRLEGFKEFYSEEFNIDVEINIIDAVGYFSEYFKITGAPYPKISRFNLEKSKGDINETESPLAYVPYRNTQFALLMAARAEAWDYKNVDFLFGLNLSEGMVFMDNSEGWLETVNNMVKYGGKDFKITGTYDVVSPYFERTKTNMLKEFMEKHGFATLEQLLDLSTSCYYPKEDGSPCDECGSCILREKAITSLSK